jgi:hypothetical protein
MTAIGDTHIPHPSPPAPDLGRPKRSGGNPAKRHRRDNRSAAKGIPRSATGATWDVGRGTWDVGLGRAGEAYNKLRLARPSQRVRRRSLASCYFRQCRLFLIRVDLHQLVEEIPPLQQ